MPEQLGIILPDTATLNAENIRSWFIRSLQIRCMDFIINDQYEVVDQFINANFDSMKDRLLFKRDIPGLEYFVERDEFDLAEKLLDWQCWRPIGDEFTWNCVKSVYKYWFRTAYPPVNRLCVIWKECSTNLNVAEERSSRFLNWLIRSEVGINRFKKEELAKPETKILFEGYAIPTGVIERFFHWCGLTEEEVQQMMNAH